MSTLDAKRSCESSWIALTEPPPRPHDEPGRDAVDGRDDHGSVPERTCRTARMCTSNYHRCLKSSSCRRR